MENYEEMKMSINLTRIWLLGGEECPYFLFHLTGTIIHEFPHLFFYDNEMYEEHTEKKVFQLARYLKLLSIGDIIRADDANLDRVLRTSSS